MMNKNTILFIVSIVIGVFVLILFSNRYTNKKIETAVKERRKRNALQEIIDSTGNKHPVINDNLKGKTIVINVWATWCIPCREEVPELNKLVKKYSTDNIVFIALDERDSTKEMKVMKEKGIQFDYQLLFDQEELIDILYSFELKHESRGVPLNMVINVDGKIEHYYVGNRPEKLQKIREYLIAITTKENN